MSYKSKRDSLARFKQMGADKGKTITLKTAQFCEECNEETGTKVYLDHYGFGQHLKVCRNCEVPR